MTPQEYIKAYKMDHYHPYKFDYDGFLQGLGQEFESRTPKGITYSEFNAVIADMDRKFNEILVLRKKRGRLSQSFFKVFFAMYVVPRRRELFPEKQAQIEERKKANGKKVNN